MLTVPKNPVSVRNGAFRLDFIVLVGLFAVAAALWFVRMGGEEGLSNFMVKLSWQMRNISEACPWW